MRNRTDRKNILAMRERAAHGAVHLRHAAQAVSVLHAWIILCVRLADLAFAQEREEMARHGLLTRMRAGAVDPLVERDGRPFERLECHCSGDIGDTRETFRPKERESADCMHCLRAVEQCEAFLGLQIGRLKTGFLQRVRAHIRSSFKKSPIPSSDARDEPAGEIPAARRTLSGSPGRRFCSTSAELMNSSRIPLTLG